MRAIWFCIVVGLCAFGCETGTSTARPAYPRSGQILSQQTIDGTLYITRVGNVNEPSVLEPPSAVGVRPISPRRATEPAALDMAARLGSTDTSSQQRAKAPAPPAMGNEAPLERRDGGFAP